ncbi:23S rRNA (guanosine(2251)-2'-O)-methyltransferase RlmB [Flavobacteriaceae bacterium]|nr:23S rRNA (guanosine(2251)-2'-O)-methyltransferase RlmB [Flavobacteriaceae bacterium]
MEINEIFGSRAIIEAISAETQIEKIFILKDTENELSKELFTLIKKYKIAFQYVPIQKFRKFEDKNHQGVFARIALVNTLTIDELFNKINIKNNPTLLLLDKVNDVRNFGAIARTASCTGVEGIIILDKGAAPINADAIKTSAGALFKIPVCKVNHLKDAIYYLQGEGFQVVAATEKAEQLIYHVDLNKPTAIIMGSEERGINPSTLKICDEKAKLPMTGEIASLNVSVACGAFLYEAMRQKLD